MESTATAFAHLVGNYQFQTAAYVLYVYDHMLTFSEEVDKIWSQPFTFASLLFYLNRYITHCQFIIIQVEFHETTWSESLSVLVHNLAARFCLLTIPIRCRRYVPFDGGATLSLVVVAELIMTLRIYALYLRNKFVLAFLLLVISGQVVVTGWALHFSEPVPLPPGFPGCVLTGSTQGFAAFWAAPIVTDSCIFSLTLWRTIRYRTVNGYSSTVQVILRDGSIYFALIFSANLMNTIIYFSATQDLKAVGASFSQIVTAIMIARLQLNLRQVKSQSDGSRDPGMAPGARRSSSDLGATRWRKRSAEESQQTASTFLSVGNLGGELTGTFFELEGRDDLEKVEEVEEVELCDLRPLDRPQRAHLVDSEASSSRQDVLV